MIFSWASVAVGVSTLIFPVLLFTHFIQPQYNYEALAPLFNYFGRHVALFLWFITVDSTLVQPRCSSHQHSRKLSCRVEQEHNMLANPGLPAVRRWREGYGSQDRSPVLHADLLQFTQGEEANCNLSFDCGLRKQSFKTNVDLRCGNTMYQMYPNSTHLQSGAMVADPLVWAYNVTCVKDR